MTTTMGLEETVRILSTMSEKDHAGRHFTTRYSDAVLAELRDRGLIEVTVPVHESTGLDYAAEYHRLAVTQEGIDLVESCPEYHDAD